MFDYIYKKLYILGLYTARYLGRFFNRASGLLLKPFKALGAFFVAGFAMLRQSFLQRADEMKELAEDVKNSNKTEFFSQYYDDKKGFGKLLFNIKRAFSRHGIALTVITQIIAPALSLAVLIFTVNYWSSKNLALKVTYNNADLGCVASESVYIEAQKKAGRRLETAAVAGEGAAKLKSSEYAIVPAKLTELKDSDTVCNSIIERSGNNITNACGIYIDGDFLCAVKNETDAQTVFDNLLSDYKEKSQKNDGGAQTSRDEAGDDNSATYSFAEKIEYIQGLYPDDKNTILDAAQLSKKLTNNQKEAVYYIANDGDTFAGVAGQYNISVSELKKLNPDLSAYLKEGDRVLISRAQDYVRVQYTRTETRTVDIAYKTVEIEAPNLYKGIRKTVTEGKKGKQEITELVTYIDGKKVSSKEVSRKTLVQAVDKKVRVGTKKNPYGTATSYGGRFLWPAIGAYNISSYFGYRSMGWHGGVDIIKAGGHSTGTPIVAAGDGTVVSAGYHYSWGYNVVINHGNGLSTRYAHMLAGSFKVSPGQQVYAGQPIGNVGSSGNVTGPHLHFEVMINGRRVNPMPYLGR